MILFIMLYFMWRRIHLSAINSSVRDEKEKQWMRVVEMFCVGMGRRGEGMSKWIDFIARIKLFLIKKDKKN